MGNPMTKNEFWRLLDDPSLPENCTNTSPTAIAFGNGTTQVLTVVLVPVVTIRERPRFAPLLQ